MMRYGFFDSEITGYDEEGMPIFDRAESSDFLATFISRIISDGVLGQPGDCFQVTAYTGMKVKVRPGFGIVRGRFAADEEEAEIEVSAAPAGYRRIDRVILRANYLKRMCEIVLREGVAGARPVPPELIRPESGDYYELCLANISIAAGQTSVAQADITDTRYDSRVCGVVTQVIDHLDTPVFFAQLDSFYAEFVEKSNTSYAEFLRMAQEAYDTISTNMDNYYKGLMEQGKALHEEYKADISGYIADLKSKGDADLAEITQELLDFKNTNEAAFLAWFEAIKGLLGQFEAGELVTIINTLVSRLDDMEEMIFTGMASAKLIIDDEGNYLATETGVAILADWRICQCGC